MKPNKAIAQQWADANYSGASFDRCEHSRHMFWDETRIFSYGRHFPIARYLPAERVTLLNSASYSVTTARHQSHVRGVVEGVTFRVPSLDLDHARNVAHLTTNVVSAESAVVNSRKHIDYKLESLRDARTQLRDYCEVFAQPLPVLPLNERLAVKLARVALRGDA